MKHYQAIQKAISISFPEWPPNIEEIAQALLEAYEQGRADERTKIRECVLSELSNYEFNEKHTPDLYVNKSIVVCNDILSYIDDIERSRKEGVR